MRDFLRLARRAGLLALTLNVVAPAIAHSGSIGFGIKTTVEARDGLSIAVELRNTGDEAAAEVKPTVSFADRLAVGASQRRIEPGQTRSWTLSIADLSPGPGAHVAIVRVAYEDANGYPFEVLAAAKFGIDTPARKPIGGSIQLPPLRESDAAKGKLILQVPKERGREVDVALAVPSGLIAAKKRFRLRADDRGRVEVPFELQNASLLPGTVVNVYALVTAVGEQPPQTDVVQADVRILAPKAAARKHAFANAALALLLYVVALELLTGFRRRGAGKTADDGNPWATAAAWALALTPSAFLLSVYPWASLLSDTVTAGGDMASLYYPTKLLSEEILPSGQLTGWTMGNYAGFPVFHFYSTLPFVLIVLLGKIIAMPVAFKLVTLIGPTLLPAAAAFLFRSLGYSRGASGLAAASVLPFLLQQGNSMWGGNIPSVLAGEFCHSIGITLSLVFLGVLQRIANGRGSWPLAALLLGVIGLCHTFAFFAAVWYSLFFVWPRKDVGRTAPPIIAVYIVAFLLLCFWGLPLPGRLVFTSEWSMIWRIKEWKEVLPQALWPAGFLAAVGLVLSVVRLKEFRSERQGLLLFVFCGGILLYFLVPAIGFPDIRFIPISQLFLGFMAADLVAWATSKSRHTLALSAVLVAAVLAWGDAHLGYIPSWLKWNYSGYQGKNTWSQFKEINEAIRGDVNDARVVFEHSEAHNRFGSSRAFENLPLFSGRSTLEGVFHQASHNSPFIFFLQSEVSERGSGPFPQYTYTRLNPEKALPHLRLYNVDTVIAVSDKARQAYEQHPAFKKIYSSATYAVFQVEGGNTGYVVPATHEPVLYDGPDWKIAFYRWFKHHELLDVPLVPAELLEPDQRREFSLRTDAVERLPRRPLGQDCEVNARLEQYRIHIKTTCPGQPHIIKVSYFPRWHTLDGSRLLPVSPGFMLIYPRSEKADVVYRRDRIDWFGLGITVFGVITLTAFGLSRAMSETAVHWLQRGLSPLLSWWSRRRIPLSVALVVLGVGCAAGTRLLLRAPDRGYEEAQEAYKTRDFPTAVRLYEDWTKEDRDTFKQATALFHLGVSHSELTHHAAAIAVHERLRFQFPNVDYTAGILFHLARNYAAIGSLEEARSNAAALFKGYPDSSWARRAKTELPPLVNALKTP